MSNTIQITEAMVDAGCKAIIDLRGHGEWPTDFTPADQSVGRQNIRAALEAALSAQMQDMASMADDIEKLDVDYNISEFYGLSDWAAFAAGIAKGRAAAAELVRTKAPERR